MIVRHLSLTDFRNYETADVTLVPGVNLFVGSNGQGKTNLVEAIGYLSTLGSHRVSADQALIRAGTDTAIVRAHVEHDARTVLVELQVNRGSTNRAQVNRVAVKVRELPHYLSSVAFAPEDLALVRGDPAGRRRFLDQLLAQLTPRLAGVQSDYERVVKQRTTLLKSARSSRIADSQLSTLDVWDERLVELGTEIVVARAGLVNVLQPQVAAAYQQIAAGDHGAGLAIRLSILGAQPDDDSSPDQDGTAGEMTADEVREAFQVAVTRIRRTELDRGLTLVGPHRDDLLLRLNDLPARGYASQGESWSFSLALKLASAAILRTDSPLGDPVVILDDVFAELDQARRAQLAAAISDYEQVLITAAVIDDVPPDLRANTVQIRAGRIITESLGTP